MEVPCRGKHVLGGICATRGSSDETFWGDNVTVLFRDPKMGGMALRNVGTDGLLGLKATGFELSHWMEQRYRATWVCFEILLTGVLVRSGLWDSGTSVAVGLSLELWGQLGALGSGVAWKTGRIDPG